MVAGKQKDAKISPGEKKIRQEEDILFGKISAPPSKLEGVFDILGDDQPSESVIQQRLTEKKRQRENDVKQATKLKKLSKET